MVLFHAFFGGPGTGKTHRLKSMASAYCHIISPTWTNATLTGGETIFSWCKCSFMKPAPRPFIHPTVFIDEVFMFDRDTMQLIMNCISPSTQTIYMFGDPFQIRQPTKERDESSYFYNATWNGASLRELMTVETLTVYYRSAGDPGLQALLQSYRSSHRFVKSELLRLIPRVNTPPEGALTIVNTHRKEASVQRHIHVPAQERLQGQDGVVYRRGQRVFIVRHNGAIQRQGFIHSVYPEGAYVEVDGEETLFPPRVSNGRVKYDFVRGDVVVINLVQGQEFDCPVCICVDDFFEFGAIYTALSRVKKLSQLSLLCDNEKEKVFETDLENYYI